MKEFNHGGLFFEFLGYGLNGTALFVEETKLQRQNGMPNHLLVIQNCDEYVDCINVENNHIVSWSCYDHNGIIDKGMNFYEYFIDCIENAIENF